MDPELKQQLEGIVHQLEQINKKSGSSVWKSFLSGVLNALGYVVGLAIVIVVLGWVLQKTGLWSVFQQRMQDFSSIIEQAKKLTEPGNTSTTPSTSRGSTSTVILPNGQQVQVQLPQ